MKRNERQRQWGRKDPDTKIIRKMFAYNELDTLADVISQQAAEGWELTSMSGGLGFRRAEKRRIKVACEVVCSDIAEERDEFAAFCQAAGWKRIMDDGMLQIFTTEDLDAEPIHTDPAVKLQQVHRKCLTSAVLPSVVVICVGLLLLWQCCWNPGCNEYLTGRYEIALFSGPVGIVIALIGIVRYFLWYAGAKKAVSRGEPAVYRKDSKVEKAADIFADIYIAVWILGCFAAVLWYSGGRVTDLPLLWLLLVGAVSLALIFYLQRRDARRGTGGRRSNVKYGAVFIAALLIFITGLMLIVTKMDTAPGSDKLRVSMEDLGIETTGRPDRICSNEGFIFLRRESGSDFSENQKGLSFYYDIYTAWNDEICQKVLKERYRYLTDGSRDVRQISPESFGAEKAYLCSTSDSSWKTWLILYEDKIVSVEANFDLTKEQQAVIGEKLCR